jgi:hypothetical protein
MTAPVSVGVEAERFGLVLLVELDRLARAMALEFSHGQDPMQTLNQGLPMP